MSEYKLTTPVAFIIFNRPDTTERVFTEIAKAKPPKLLVIGDGPRSGQIDEVEKVAAARAVIKKVNWPCEVMTNFSESNIGCKKRVSSGIDWVFRQVEEAIILEDDCVPHQSFFRFCQELLTLYREDCRIGMICGTNLATGIKHQASYFYSRIPRIWGWATWRRVWKYYDVDFKGFEDNNYKYDLINSFSVPDEAKHWLRIIEEVRSNKVDTWDAQILHMAFRQSFLSIFPAGNLVTNIGFRYDGTHTKNSESDQANLGLIDIDFPLIHPTYFLPSNQANLINRKCDNINPFIFRHLKNLTHKTRYYFRSLRSRLLKLFFN